jgi:thiol-disulfide isomerase/thioredoxin
MSARWKPFLFGLGTGVALTLVLLQSWSDYLVRSESEEDQPKLLRVFPRSHTQPSPRASEMFPRPTLASKLSNRDMRWKLTAMDGTQVTLAQLKGRVLFLNFWGTTCEPCLEEMPGIARLYQSLNNENFSFLVITTEGRAEVRSFLQKNDLGVPVYLNEGQLAMDLPVPGVPTTYILDTDSNIVFMHSGALNWDDDGARAYLRELAARSSTNN